MGVSESDISENRESSVMARLLLSSRSVFIHSPLKGSCLSSREENFPQLFFLKKYFLKKFLLRLEADLDQKNLTFFFAFRN